MAAFYSALGFLVLYPRPALYLTNLEHALHPPIEPAAVAQVSASLPDDSAVIERWVRSEIPFDANDYAAWGGVFYIATPEEVLARGRGPCYGRAVVLASILEARGIPYRLMANTTHVCVDYEGREPFRWYERPAFAAFSTEDGRWRFQGMGWLAPLPQQAAWLAGHLWATVPWPGKVILLSVLVCTGSVCLWWRLVSIRGERKPRKEAS